jgi:hypothetical protein
MRYLVHVGTKLISLFAVSFATIPSFAQQLRCEWSQKQQCDAGKACVASAPSVWATIDLGARRYQRCDRNGCDTYDVVVTKGAGVYTVIDLPGRGMLAKMHDDGTAIEVVTLGTSVLVSHGRCVAPNVR